MTQKRSRFGCANCKKLKVKCSETKPSCERCIKRNEKCDYSIKLSWGGRPYKKQKVEKQSVYPAVTCSTPSSSSDSDKSTVLDNVFDLNGSLGFLSSAIDHLADVSNFSNDQSSLLSNITFSPFIETQSPKARLYDVVSESFEEDNQNISQIIPQSKSFLTDSWLLHPGQKSVLPIDDDTECIPQALSPLPDMLLSVPYYLESFHYYLDVSANSLVPDPSRYKSNPFKVILPRLAMSGSTILSIMIAFAISHRCLSANQPEPKQVVDQLISRAMDGLLKALKDKETSSSDTTLSAVLLLSSYKLFCMKQSRWKIHLKGARQILLRKGMAKPFQSIKAGRLPALDRESNVTFFLARWFAYFDVIGSLSCPLLPTSEEITDYLKNRSSDNGIDYNNHALSLGSHEIDPFLGFDINILPYLSELVSLIKETSIILSCSGNPYLFDRDAIFLPIKLIERAMEIQMALQSAAGFPYENLDHTLIATNKIFCITGLLNLHRRVMLVPSFSPVVQSLCKQSRELFESRVERGSSADICAIFALFCAGCESIEQDDRIFFKDRLANLGSPSALKASQIMQRSWDSEMSWMEILHLADTDMVFV